jgi:hypothetical protein
MHSALQKDNASCVSNMISNDKKSNEIVGSLDNISEKSFKIFNKEYTFEEKETVKKSNS